MSEEKTATPDTTVSRHGGCLHLQDSVGSVMIPIRAIASTYLGNESEELIINGFADGVVGVLYTVIEDSHESAVAVEEAIHAMLLDHLEPGPRTFFGVPEQEWRNAYGILKSMDERPPH